MIDVHARLHALQQARPLRRVCREHGIQFQAYSSLGTQHHVGINPVLRHPVLTPFISLASLTPK